MAPLAQGIEFMGKVPTCVDSLTDCKSRPPTARQPPDVSREVSPDMVDRGSVSGAHQESRVSGGLTKGSRQGTGSRDQSSRRHAESPGDSRLRDQGETSLHSYMVNLSNVN